MTSEIASKKESQLGTCQYVTRTESAFSISAYKYNMNAKVVTAYYDQVRIVFRLHWSRKLSIGIGIRKYNFRDIMRMNKETCACKA